jgi:hypothetical protein
MTESMKRGVIAALAALALIVFGFLVAITGSLIISHGAAWGWILTLSGMSCMGGSLLVVAKFAFA